MKTNLRNQKGMSLFELIIAIGIIGTIAGLLLSGVSESQLNAEKKETQILIKRLVQQVKLYKTDHKKYPSSLDDLVSDYLEEIPTDPWGGDIYYETPGSHANKKFEIWSAGPDEEEDTDDDITSWKKAVSDE